MKRFNKIIALLLVMITIISTLSSCGKKDSELSEDNQNKITEIVTNILTPMITEQPIMEGPDNFQAKAIPMVYREGVSYNWEDYVGNVDTFVYGLLVNQFELVYDIFCACITLEDGTVIHGLAFSDYEYVFEAEEDGMVFFPAGFVSFIGEPDLPKSLIDEGIEVENLDNTNDKYGFVLAYETPEFRSHCVVWDKYINYGIDNAGKIFYTCSDYNIEKCDRSLGALYSYDKEAFIFDSEFGNFIPPTGKSLYSWIDYNELQEEVNRILEKQDEYFKSIDVQTIASYSKSSIEAALFARQEECFMGYRVKDLFEIASELDCKEYINYTPDGIYVAQFEPYPPEEPTKLTKWLLGIGTAITVIACVGASIIMPALTALTGAISGAAVDAFMQVVIENQTVSNINWKKVAVSAAAGALFAWACPALASSASNLAVHALGQTASEIGQTLVGYASYYGVLALSTGFVSGVTSAANVLIDGKSWDDARSAFLFGTALGAAFSIAVPLLGKGIGYVGKKIAAKIPHEWLTNIVDKAKGKVVSFINKHNIHQIHLKNTKLDDLLTPKSAYKAVNQAIDEVRAQQCSDEFVRKAIRQLPSAKNKNFKYYNLEGKEIPKEALYDLNGNGVLKISDACDDEIKKKFLEKGITELQINNGIIDFGPVSEYEFVSTLGIGPDRAINMKNYYEQLADTWSEKSSEIPERIKEGFKKMSVELDDISPDDVQRVLSNLQITPHEDTNNTVYLIDTFLHSKVSHAGGVSYAKTVAEIEIIKRFNKEIYSTTPRAIYGSLITEAS